MSIPVKLWWDNRTKLTMKMLSSLLGELTKMRDKLEVEILFDKPAFGTEQAERDRRNYVLLDDLDYKINECQKLLDLK